jgi:hypothetical protein
MAVTPVQLIGGAFQDCSGNVLVNGYLTMFLSQDANIAGVGDICSGISVRIQLDAHGNVSVTPPQYVWGNDQMLPVNTFYRVFGYTANGQLAFGPDNQQVFGNGGTFNVGTWIPNQVISWVPPLQPLLLETNGTKNGSQSLLNLVAGNNMTITDDGQGDITFAATGGGFQNWIGFNAAGTIGESVNSSGVGSTWQLTGSSSTPLIPPTATQTKAVNQNAQSAGFSTSFGLLDQNLDLSPGTIQDWLAKTALLGATFARYWIGFSDVVVGGIGAAFPTNTPSANFIGFRFSAGTDTHLVAVCQTDSTHQTIVDTGISPTLSASPQLFEVIPTSSGTVINFYINKSLVATISTNVPAASTPMGSFIVFDGQANVTSNASTNIFYLYALLNS